MNAPDASKTRFAWIDVARGLAAVCVMTQHSLEGAGILGLKHGQFSTSWLNLGETGVAIFFLISGFIIPASVQGTSTFADFWIRRFARIYPLYWVTFGVTLLLTIALFGGAPTMLGLTIGAHLLFIQEWVGMTNYVGGSWTLLLELIWYIIFSLLFFSRLFGDKTVLSLGLTCYIGMSLLLWIVYPDAPFGRMSLLALCFLGYGFLLHNENIVSSRFMTVTAALFVTLLVIDLYVGFQLRPSHAFAEPSFRCVAISWGLALAAFPAILFLRNSSLVRSRFMIWLGQVSFSVYLMHSVVLRVLEYLRLSGPIFVVLTFAITLVAASFTYRFIEMPGISLGRRLVHRRTRSIPATVAAVAVHHSQ